MRILSTNDEKKNLARMRKEKKEAIDGQTPYIYYVRHY